MDRPDGVPVTTNHRILLRSRPKGIPQPADFASDQAPICAPGSDEVLLETLLLSIDPAMRSWMLDTVPLGDVMRGGGIARVLESRSAAFQPGELVQARLGWQTQPTLPAHFLQKVDETRGDALAWIGPLGLSAVTAYFGMRDIGGVKPGDRVLVSAAAGGVGQVAAQIARIEACRVTGMAGGADKCAWLRDTLHLDAVIDYKAENDLAAAIGRACPEGIDLYFDNVGGPTLDAALLHLREGARVVLCGRISQVAADAPYGIVNLGQILSRRARMQGFQVFRYHDRYEEARAWLAARLRDGQLRQRLHILDGLHHAPAALGMLFRGENTGKLVVRVAG
ncbi:MAG TPA: NADP-dependent oxidoreductase [Acetobacteraceae bacterium]|nr:NADP-dependent oxidoreductase [Acetobacteraceae bacterium]